MNHSDYFLNHMYQAVQDKFDLSDEQMDTLLNFLQRFDSPKTALRNALRERNRDAMNSILENMSRKHTDKGSIVGPSIPRDSLLIPSEVPVSQNMIINHY